MDKLIKVLDKYRDVVGFNSKKARQYIQRLDYSNNFYLLMCIAQTYLDEAIFEDNSDNIRSNINFRKWRMAEKYIIKAFQKSPDNGEVVYKMGVIRKQNFQDDIAIYCFKKVIKMGANKISKQEYSGDINFAKELINDAKFELYRLHYHNNKKLANRYLKQFKHGLENGISTIFNPLENFLLD